MTNDEPAIPAPHAWADDRPHEPDRPLPKRSALRDSDSDVLGCMSLDVITPVSVLVGVYVKAYIETLAQHNAESLIKAVRHGRRWKGKKPEMVVGPGNKSAATIAITDETPDEARLALLDLDVTAEELRGKVLAWDAEAGSWRPDGTEPPGKGYIS